MAGEWFDIYQLIGRNPSSEESRKLARELCSLYQGPGMIGELGVEIIFPLFFQLQVITLKEADGHIWFHD